MIIKIEESLNFVEKINLLNNVYFFFLAMFSADIIDWFE